MKRFLGLLVLLGPAMAHADKTFNSGSGATWDCAKDSEVTINTSGGAYALKGTCKDVTVNGSSVKVTIENAEELTVNGAKNTVTVTGVDEIQVNGANNKVAWKKGLTGAAPQVTNLGTGNTIAADATAATTTTTATTTAAAADATVMDCGKQKNVSITKGKGNYKITGTCDKVAISGGDNKLVIEAAKNLAVTGSGNEIAISKADKIAAMGSRNKVTWGAGLTVAKPKIATIGKGNTIVAASAAVPTLDPDKLPSTTKTGAIAPMPGNTIDCAKTASRTIDTDDGNYTFVGKCALITVDGNNNTLKIDSAKAISVNGNNNVIEVTAVDKLATPGNNNTARWKKGVSGAKAKVANPGNNNTVLRTK